MIIGTGPSGATTALLLARLGVKSLAISRHRNTANTPRAHIFNQRAMEVLRDAGLEKGLNLVASTAQGKFLLSIDPSFTAMELTLDDMQICSIRRG